MANMCRIGEVTVGSGHPLVLIAGPCVLEGGEIDLQIARELAVAASEAGVPLVFKASFDKANRTSLSSKRGPGLEEGLRTLASIRETTGLPVCTDIHEPEQAAMAAPHVDLLQVPAFLCRQTDLLRSCAETGKAVNVKKGQFLAPWDCINIAGKLRAFGCERFLITERGTTFGYNNLVADMRSLYWMRKEGIPVIFDGTHSVQRPGGLGGTTGGDAELAPVLARAAMATGVDGIFMETHSNPAEALSDAPSQIPLDEIEAVLFSLMKIHQALSP